MLRSKAAEGESFVVIGRCGEQVLENLAEIQRALLRMLAYLLEILVQKKNWAIVQ